MEVSGKHSYNWFCGSITFMHKRTTILCCYSFLLKKIKIVFIILKFIKKFFGKLNEIFKINVQI